MGAYACRGHGTNASLGARNGGQYGPIGFGQNTHLPVFADFAILVADCSFTVLGTEEPAIAGMTNRSPVASFTFAQIELV